jgi:dTDP-4-dehydrorhamnose 3,5-epimerase-like enzyme
MSILQFMEKIDVQSFGDARGNLGVSELGINPKFLTKRIYYLSDVPTNASRGMHGHKKLKQIFYAVTGSFQLTVTDGALTESVTLTALSHAYFVPEGLWRELNNFSSNCVCLVLASEPFDESDYIHDFNEYKSWRTPR